MLPLLRPGTQEGGQERMSRALVEWEGLGKHPGETFSRSGALEESPALGVEVGFPADRRWSLLSTAWAADSVEGGQKERCVSM